MTVKQSIQELMIEQDITQGQLAEMAEVSRRTIIRFLQSNVTSEPAWAVTLLERLQAGDVTIPENVTDDDDFEENVTTKMSQAEEMSQGDVTVPPYPQAKPPRNGAFYEEGEEVTDVYTGERVRMPIRDANRVWPNIERHPLGMPR